MYSSKFSVLGIQCKRYMSHLCKLKPIPPQGIVTIIDVNCPMCVNLALLLKQNPEISELRLYSKNNVACGIAMDLSSIDTSTRIRAYTGLYLLRDAILGAEVVVFGGGSATKPCTTNEEIFKQNIDETRTIAMYMAEFNPKAIFCIARPPLNALVPMASEEYIKAEVYDHRKIIGLTAIANMRANHYIAEHSKKDASQVVCPVIGGLCRNTTVSVFSQARPPLSLSESEHDKLQSRIAQAEDRVLEVKQKEKTGGCYLATALANSRFINSVIKALKGESNVIECAYVRQTGHIAKFLPYMASIVLLGPDGVQSSHMPKVSAAEAKRLKCAHTHLMDQVALGESIATGGLSLLRQKKCRRKKIKCALVLRGKKHKKKKKGKGKGKSKGKKKVGATQVKQASGGGAPKKSEAGKTKKDPKKKKPKRKLPKYMEAIEKFAKEKPKDSKEYQTCRRKHKLKFSSK